MSGRIDKILGVKGMNDLLPDDMARWEWLEATVGETLRQFGYTGIRTPIVEPTALFVRGVGEATDIVEKEMYSFEDRLNGEQLTLRPENTAAVVRAVVEHNLLYDGPRRLWYFGPMFRHERPQKGRYRQFYQFGAEALGVAEPQIDAEQIQLVWLLWERLGLKAEDRPQLQLNSLGSREERAAHRHALVEYFQAHQEELDDDSRRRLLTNPLRILDTKNPAMQGLVEAAPQLVGFLGEESQAHLNAVTAALTAAEIPYTLNPRLVRGLDYYCQTVFEWVTDRLGSQGTVCGGGRYDGLAESLGGKPAPACGFAIGAERLLALLEACEVQAPAPHLDVYLVHWGDGSHAAALQAAYRLRRSGLRVLQHPGGGSLKSQMKRADASGAQVAVLLGDGEREQGTWSLKFLRMQASMSELPQQTRLPADEAQALLLQTLRPNSL